MRNYNGHLDRSAEKGCVNQINQSRTGRKEAHPGNLHSNKNICELGYLSV